MPQKTVHFNRYGVVFILTTGLFVSAFFLSNFFTDRKLENIKQAENKISIDILSSETQFSLLSELSCRDVGVSSLSQELNSLAAKIEFGDKNLGTNEDLIELKKYYSLLEIKDYLLMNRISERCGTNITSILYVYTTKENCSECEKQGIVLTALREKYPDLRVYSFDYNLDLSALKSLLSIYHIEDTKLPAVIVGDHVSTGFHSLEDIEKMLPSLKKPTTSPVSKDASSATDTTDSGQ